MGGKETARTWKKRLARLDWPAVWEALDHRGWATAPLLTPTECAGLIALWPEQDRFRSRIEMARFRFGEGAYQYFRYPLPRLIAEARAGLYPGLAAAANRWQERLGVARRFPSTLNQYLEACRREGQTKPTPLLLRYETGGYNCLHQDLYGDVAFPLQVTGFLSRRGLDYEGGEFLLVEQRPRAQSRGEAIQTDQGEMVIFTTRWRPVAGARGHFRATMRHGVSRVLRGSRYTLGIIFHNAR